MPSSRWVVGSAAIGAALALAGCVGGGPSFTPAEMAAVRATSDLNEAEARAHRITFAEAARRDVAKAREVGGARITPDDELNFALRAALAAEVDAGRMTPETATLRYQEQLARQRQVVQAREDEQRRRFGEAMAAAGDAMQNAAAARRSVNCTSQTVGTFTNTSCF